MNLSPLLTQSRDEGAHARQRPRLCLTGGGQLVSCYSRLKLICFSLWEKLAELPGSTIGFSLLSGELLGGSAHRKRFFFFSFLLSGEGNKHFKRAFKKSWSLQENPGSFSFNRAAVFGNALRKLPGALANLLVNSRRVSLLLAPGETAGAARVGLHCQLCAVFSNKNWPVGALVLKERELEMRGAVTAIQGQTQDAQGGRIRWRYLPFGFSDLLNRVKQPRGKHFKILARETTCPDSPLHGFSWAQPLSTVNFSNLCRLGL